MGEVINDREKTVVDDVWDEYRVYYPDEARRILSALPWGPADIDGRYQAIEFETAESPHDRHALLRFMKANRVLAVYDGSINGSEYVSTPRKGVDFGRYVRDLVEECVRRLYDPIVDRRCGVHIHTDVRDLTPDQVRRTVRVWCLVQDSVFRHLVGEFRANTGYADRLDYGAYDDPDCWLTACGSSRYYAWSATPWRKRGSIEFRAPGWPNCHESWWHDYRVRQHVSDVMSEYILSCARVARAIVEVAKSDDKYRQFLRSIPAGINRQFGDDADRLWILADVAGVKHPRLWIFDDLQNPAQSYVRRVSRR